MRLTVALLVVALITVATLLHSQSASIRELERAIQQLNLKVAEKTATAGLELQAKCSDQARKAFTDMGYTKNEIAGYESHYNPQINKCFVQIQNTDAKISPGAIWTYRNVFDAFEGKEYGTYSWHTEKDKKYWAVPPFQCEVMLQSGEKKLCHSDGEFTELVKVWMDGR